jgi:hypothetical protein
MTHELFALMRENPLGTFIIILAVLWAFERMVTTFLNRNKPVCECDCCQEEETEEEGGEEDDEA